MISVLYIDDSPGLIREVKQFLERSGKFLVDGYGSDIDAFTHFPFTGYDVIITVSELTGMNGSDILLKVREHDPIIPFILITNTFNPRLTDEFLVQGVDYTLQRRGPLLNFYEELSQKITRLVKRKERERHFRDRIRKEMSQTNPYLDRNWVITRGGKTLFGGSEIASSLSITMEELWKTDIFSFMSEEEKCRCTFISDTVTDFVKKNFEFTLTRTDHQSRSMITRELKVSHNENGEELFIFQGLSDISRKKTADHLLCKINQISEILLDTIDGVIWIINTVSMRFSFVSSSSRRVFGYPAEALIGGDISKGNVILTSSPVSDIIWERAVCHLSSDNPPGLYSDCLTYCKKNGTEIMTEGISEFFLNEDKDVLMMRGYVKKSPDTHSSDFGNSISDTQPSRSEKIRNFLETVPDMISSVKSVSGNEDILHLGEKVDLLRFASHHQCTWECDNCETVDHELSDLQSLYDQF